MRDVYRARNQRRERELAVKVLPAGTLADAAVRKRSRQKARAVANLNYATS